MADITMPQMGETVTEGTVTKWFKKLGEQVAEDEVLFEVSTDKVDSEVPSVASGVLSEILVQEGETVDVGTKLAVVSDQATGAPAASSGDGQPESEPSPADDEAGAEQNDEGSPDGGGPGAEEGDGSARPAKAVAEAESASSNGKTGASPSPDDDTGRPAPAPEPAATATATAAPPKNEGVLLSPVVRRMISEHDLDVGQISGTGRDGRVTRSDVEAYIKSKPAAAPGDGPKTPGAAPSTSAAGKGKAPAAAPRTTRADSDDERIPFSNIRRRTAEHMLKSQATSAHVLTSAEVDYSAVDRVRLAIKDEFKAEEGFSLTYLPFVARAVIDALEDFSHLNASVGENELILHRRVHLGFAVDLNFEGLMVPVIHDADSMRLRPIARAIADLAARARSRDVSADEVSGSTFTITNPGPFDTFLTAPMINQPQVGIVSTDTVRKRPVVIELPDGDDAIAIRPMGMLALSFDHRAVDGAYASAFLAKVKSVLQTRQWADEL